MANLTITAADVQVSEDVILRSGVAGVAIAQGDVLYIDLTDSNKLKLASAVSAEASVFAGIAVNAAAPGQPVQYVQSGLITIGGTLVLGRIYCISVTPGKLCPSADLVAGYYLTVIGIPTTTTVLSIDANSTGIALAA